MPFFLALIPIAKIVVKKVAAKAAVKAIAKTAAKKKAVPALTKKATTIAKASTKTKKAATGAKKAKTGAKKKRSSVNKKPNPKRKVTKKSDPTGQTKQKSARKNDPVDAIHGYVYHDFVDFEYPGVIPFAWNRHWNSGNINTGALGHGSGCLYTMFLRIDHEFVFVNEEGREIYFDKPWGGQTIVKRDEMLSLTINAGKFEIFNYETRQRYIFDSTMETYIYPLMAIEDESRDHRISLEYDKKLRLTAITDTAGRHFDVITNDTGQITKISYDKITLVEYKYDSLLNLVGVTDAKGKETEIKYKKHLMIKRSMPDNFVFHWEYDGKDESAKCIHTWGDNGLLEGFFEYHDEHTVYTNSHGDTEIFYFDKDKNLTRYIDANKAETTYTYTEHGEVASETTADGETTEFVYNDFGQTTQVLLPTGAIQSTQYDEQGRLISETAPNGAKATYTYDTKGRITNIILPTGAKTSYLYNTSGILSAIEEGEGENIRRTEIEYDEQLNPTLIKYPNGSIEQFKYDKHGNCIETTNPLGAVDKMQYDKSNRMVAHYASDGNVTHLAYNSFDDVIHLKDNHREIHFEYSPLGELSARKEHNRVLKMSYDTEGRLSYVENEANEKYAYDRDPMGNVICETGYDGVIKRYRYSPGGKLIGVCRGESTGWTELLYDKTGQLSEIKHPNGDAETFTHGVMGELLVAQNKNAKLQFEYDIMGNIIKEMQNGHIIESEYSKEYGQRIKLTTSLGLQVDTTLNNLGLPSQLSAVTENGVIHQSNYTYNPLGQVAERAMPSANGDLIKKLSAYDKQGRLTEQSVNRNNSSHASRRRNYNWSAGDRLKSIADTGIGVTLEYKYDKFGIPFEEQIKTGASPLDSRTSIRHLDDVGNVYETTNMSDRTYGSGGQLISVRDRRYSYNDSRDFARKYKYNDSGDLIEKSEDKGKIWQYQYHPSGMLEKVIRPDGKEVTFAYDPLGRRISKTFGNTTTTFIWDGDKIIHELTGQTTNTISNTATANSITANTISNHATTNTTSDHATTNAIITNTTATTTTTTTTTWLFEDDSFTPIAKLTDDNSYTITTNHLGTPTAMLDEDGREVWEAEFDLYGRVIKQRGKEECNFRFPGQYFDEETGLHYNRFRYYDPQDGMYTQCDPIGLAGGNPTLYGYVFNPLGEFDPLGLIPLNAKGFFVYGLFKTGASTPYYIGITNNIVNRTAQHIASGRLTPGSSTLQRLMPNSMNYGKARGFEQAYIEHFKTRTGVRGQPISESNLGNKNNSFNTNRTDARGKEFNSARKEKLNQLNNSNKTRGGGRCG